MSLRINTTILERFRLFLVDQVSEAEVIAHIKGQGQQTQNMKIGRAFHYLVAHPQLSLEGLYEHGGLRFNAGIIDAVLGRIESGLFEWEAERIIGKTRDDDPVLLSGKCDHIATAHLSEFKTTLDEIVLQKYVDSYQWRALALLFKAEKITYHIVRVIGDDGVFHLAEVASPTVVPYAGLEQDVKALVREFCRYLRIQKLDSYLRRDDVKAAAI